MRSQSAQKIKFMCQRQIPAIASLDIFAWGHLVLPDAGLMNNGTERNASARKVLHLILTLSAENALRIPKPTKIEHCAFARKTIKFSFLGKPVVWAALQILPQPQMIKNVCVMLGGEKKENIVYQIARIMLLLIIMEYVYAIRDTISKTINAKDSQFALPIRNGTKLNLLANVQIKINI